MKAIVFWNNLRKTPEKFFLITSLIFGLAFILLTPPLQTPDETAHFLRVYQISQFGLLSQQNNGTVGDDLPISLSKTIDVLDRNPRLEFNPETKYDLHRTKAALHIPLEKNKKTFLAVSGTSGYAPVGYIPQAIAVGLSALLNLPPVLLIYAARIGTLFAWIIMIFVSIRLIPVRKWTLAGLALLPMLVAQTGSPSVDIMSIGLGVLFISSILYLRSKSLVTGKWWMILAVLGILIALTKQTTILVVGFVLLLRAKQFDTVRWKSYIKKYSLLLLPIIGIAIWTIIVSKLHLTVSSNIEGQNGGAQLANIVYHPWRFPVVIFNTFFSTYGDVVITSFIGSFGWLDAPMSQGLVVAGYLFIGFMMTVSYEAVRQKLSIRESWIIRSIILCYMLGTMVALYLVYSPVDFDIIYGLQGRYFLLILFMALPLIIRSPLKLPLLQYVRIVKIATPIFLCLALLTVYMRFYYVGLL